MRNNQRKNSLVFVFIACLLLVGCKKDTLKVDAEKVEATVVATSQDDEAKPELCKQKNMLVNSCSQWRIALNTYEIKDDLYWVSGVGLAFKSTGVGFSYDARVDSNMQSGEMWTFETVFQPISGDNNIEKVIDVKTWRGGGFFYRDKSSFYCYHMMSDGGRLWYLEEFNPNDLKYILNDGRLIAWHDAEGDKWREIDGFHGDYLTDGEKVIDFRCSVKSMEEHKKRVDEQNDYAKKKKAN